MKRRDFIVSMAGGIAVTTYNCLEAAPLKINMDSPPDLVPTPVGEAGKWFMNEPTRIGWFTLRYSDAQKSAASFVKEVADTKINLICLTVGGSFAFYPSKIPFHQWAPGISESNDFLGEVVAAAKTHKIRIGARFDFSKQSAESVKAHPDWFFTHADNSYPVDKSGRTPPCINGDFYRIQAIRIMEEVIQRFRPALIYLNNFGNNLGGQDLPDPCQCANCKRKYREMTGKILPAKMNEQVRIFLRHCTYQAGKLFFDAAQKASPEAIFINADTTPTHGWHSESRMVIAPSQLWPYITSEAVNRQRNSFPGSVTCNNITSYSSNASRLVLMPPEETRIRFYQAIAHGSPPTYVATGTMDQVDNLNLEAAKSVFHWHALNEDLYGGTSNPAKVLLLVQPEKAPRGRNLAVQHSWRGVFRLLTEQHMPMVVSERLDVSDETLKLFDLIIVTPGAPTKDLDKYVKQGGKVLFVSEKPSFGIPSPVKQHHLTRVAYAEVRNELKFPSLKGVKYLMLSSVCPYRINDIFSGTEIQSLSFVEYPEETSSTLTYVPPMIENPAEVSQSDLRNTNIPAMLIRNYGLGMLAYLPWNLGALYDRLCLPQHALFFGDLIDQLLPDGRQIQTDAHPALEIVLQQKGDRLFVHLVNLSGQSQNNYMPAVPMNPVKIEVQGEYRSAKSRALKSDLHVVRENGRTKFTLPSLNEYDVIVLQR